MGSCRWKYDSSFPDSDPFEPQPGGCCSIMPFRFGDVVELPLTMMQDHTMFEILREPGIDRWVEKADWIARHHGLINLNVHPDYVVEQRYLDRYEAFLEYLAERRDAAWHTLPRDAARWWRQRESLSVTPDGEIRGVSEERATVAFVREHEGHVVIEPYGLPVDAGGLAVADRQSARRLCRRTRCTGRRRSSRRCRRGCRRRVVPLWAKPAPLLKFILRDDEVALPDVVGAALEAELEVGLVAELGAVVPPRVVAEGGVGAHGTAGAEVADERGARARAPRRCSRTAGELVVPACRPLSCSRWSARWGASQPQWWK